MIAGVPARRRGAPLVAIALLLAGWIGARLLVLAMWSPAAPDGTLVAVADIAAMPAGGASFGPVAKASPDPHRSAGHGPMRPAPSLRAKGGLLGAPWRPASAGPASPPSSGANRARTQAVPVPLTAAYRLAAAAPATPAAQPGPATPAPARRLHTLPTVAVIAPPALAPDRRIRRWHGDAWLLARGGGTGGGAAAALPRYGGSQAGAVLRYDLAPAAPHPAQAYLRAAAALRDAPYREGAAGISLRPHRAVPVRLAAELRISDGGAPGEQDGPRSPQLRPAAFAYTELARLHPAPGMTVDAYAQGGYVAGPRGGATAFADGLVRAERAVVARPGAAIRIGAGLWGGAQRGASRFDLGPSAAVEIGAGPAFLRISAEYRLRVAGTAAPDSGPALSIAASF